MERLFRKYLNRSPARYYLELRLDKARLLLLQTNMSVIDVALACGFVSASHFSKCYRDFFGRTPRKERGLPAEVVAPIFRAADADLVICGHTHMQFDRDIGGVRVVNAGSVGMPFDDPGAYWLLLGPDVQPRRTEYDYAEADRRLESTGYPRIEDISTSRPRTRAQMLEVLDGVALRG